jgi:hypothetical protein
MKPHMKKSMVMIENGPRYDGLFAVPEVVVVVVVAGVIDG